MWEESLKRGIGDRFRAVSRGRRGGVQGFGLMPEGESRRVWEGHCCGDGSNGGCWCGLRLP